MRFFNSVKALYVAVGILLATVAIDSYLDFRKEAMQAQHLEINTGLEKIVRFSRELTNMLMITVLDHNALRAASYDTVDNQLKTTLDTLVNLTKMQESSVEMVALSMSQGELHGYEANIMNLIKSEKWEEARAAMFGDEYVLARKMNEIDIDTAVGAVLGELSATVQRFGRIRKIALGARICALLLLLWVGIMFSRRTRADLAAQVRLRKELADANEALEQRVLERTTDLEEKTRQLARENEERLRTEARTHLILQSAGEGVFGLDSEGRVTFFNDAAETLLGYTADEITGRVIHDLIQHSHADGKPYPRDESPMFNACCRREEQHVGDAILWRKDGSMFSAAYSAKPIVDDKKHVEGAVIVFRDITERKNNEEELKRRLEELERFNRLINNREVRMIELKEEINQLHEQSGDGKKYKIVS
jgi:PAS domain S-box-containing protein